MDSGNSNTLSLEWTSLLNFQTKDASGDASAEQRMGSITSPSSNSMNEAEISTFSGASNKETFQMYLSGKRGRTHIQL